MVGLGLLQEIQATAISADGDVTVLLRQCKVLAARLANQELKDWVERELNGYPSVDTLPPYRVLNVESYGHFSGPFQSGLRNAPIPPSCLPESHRDLARKAHLVESISAYASLVKNAKGSLRIPWPADTLLAFGDRMFENMSCLEAWRAISTSSIVAVIETVKNRVLSFVLELEAEDPQAGDVGSPATLTNERVRQVFRNRIRGAARVFIGHGHSPVWKNLRHFLTDRLHLQCDDFNRESTAGRSTKERLLEMLDAATFAFLVMTGEDAHGDGAARARDNVIHEIGLFQARLGFEKAIILLEDGCTQFSNIEGVTYIAFPKGNIEAASEDIRRVLEREGALPA
jgi:predicted nucleotide-binding protein